MLYREKKQKQIKHEMFMHAHGLVKNPLMSPSKLLFLRTFFVQSTLILMRKKVLTANRVT